MRLLETKIGEKKYFLAAQLDFLYCVCMHFSIDEMEQNDSAPFMERLGKFGGIMEQTVPLSNLGVIFYLIYICSAVRVRVRRPRVRTRTQWTNNV